MTTRITAPILRSRVAIDSEVRLHLSETRRLIGLLEGELVELTRTLETLEAQDSLDDAEMQTLMQRYNQAQLLANSIMQKRDDTTQSIASKIK